MFASSLSKAARFVGLLLVFGMLLPQSGPSASSSFQTMDQSSSHSSAALSPEQKAARSPAQRSPRPMMRAGIQLLPDVGGAPLDLIVLALIGMGYGIWRLREKPGALAAPRETNVSDPPPDRASALRSPRSPIGPRSTDPCTGRQTTFPVREGPWYATGRGSSLPISVTF